MSLRTLASSSLLTFADSFSCSSARFWSYLTFMLLSSSASFLSHSVLSRILPICFSYAEAVSESTLFVWSILPNKDAFFGLSGNIEALPRIFSMSKSILRSFSYSLTTLLALSSFHLSVLVRLTFNCSWSLRHSLTISC